MKRFISLLLSAMLLLSSFSAFAQALPEVTPDPVSESASEILSEEPAPAKEKNASLRLLRELYEEQNMLVFSPLSLSIALSMAAEGADGETLAQLDAVLGKRPKAMVLEDLSFSGVKLANTALLRSDLELLPSYQDVLSDKYDAQTAPMEYGNVANQVNDWVYEHTDGLIEKLLDREPDANTVLLLINALSMKADWVSPFPAANTGFGLFQAPQGQIEVSCMRQTSRFAYSYIDGIQTVSLPYRDSTLEMLVLLPEDGNLEALIESLCVSPDEFISRYLPSEYATVRLSLPNVYAESSFELKDALMALGVTDAFNCDIADFSRMSETDDTLYIGSVLQKAVLNVNETGTEAAAATQVAMLTRGAYVENIVEMNVDRPFMMLVHDPDSGYVLFASCINNPS